MTYLTLKEVCQLKSANGRVDIRHFGVGIAVYLDGEVIASSCKGDILKNGGRFNLTADQLAQLYTWIDCLKAFEVNQSNDPSVADGMSILLNFEGTGAAQAAESDQQAILSFASLVYIQARQSNG